MCKSEIFEKVISTVSKHTEIQAENIVGGGKTREEVDARYLAVYFLKKEGFYETEIGRFMGLTSQAVRSILRQFETRRKQSGRLFEIILHNIDNQLTSN